jgi:hypothetical protein
MAFKYLHLLRSSLVTRVFVADDFLSLLAWSLADHSTLALANFSWIGFCTVHSDTLLPRKEGWICVLQYPYGCITDRV